MFVHLFYFPYSMPSSWSSVSQGEPSDTKMEDLTTVLTLRNNPFLGVVFF
jgi:hypothetical protein